MCLAIAVIALIAFQAIRIAMNAGKLSYKQVPYEQHPANATLKVLFMGDSTVVGTGTISNNESTAGWFGQDFPSADIKNFSLNGRRIAGLINDFKPSIGDHYNLIVIQIGANDIMRFTSYKDIERDLSILIDRVKGLANHVVILHSGNVGLSPIFSWPFNSIFTQRSRDVRQIYLQKAKETGVLYVDLFQEREDDFFLKDINKYYSVDHLHPSGAGYRWWYDNIRKTLTQSGVKL